MPFTALALGCTCACCCSTAGSDGMPRNAIPTRAPPPLPPPLPRGASPACPLVSWLVGYLFIPVPPVGVAGCGRNPLAGVRLLPPAGYALVGALPRCPHALILLTQLREVIRRRE
jgi:hypothetical protein